MPSFSDFCDTVTPLFADFIDSGFAENCLVHDLEVVAGRQESPWTTRGVFFDDACGRLSFASPLSEIPATLEGNARHVLVGVVNGTVTIRRHRHRVRQDPAVLDPNCLLEPLPEVVLSTGDTFAAEAWVEPVEPYGDGLLLVLQSPAVHFTSWSYDRESMRPQSLIAGSRGAARVQAALDLLSYVGTAEDADVCLRLATHPAHAIRWEAIRTAFALDHPRAMTLLKAAAHDSHPDVRQSASEALLQWS